MPAVAGRAASVILVRHAEKIDQSRDPGLTERGHARARALAGLLAASGVTRLYASQYVRTAATLEPLAEALGLPIERYRAGDSAQFAATLAQAGGEVAVIAGHSNTVPAMVRALGGSLAGLDARGNLGEDDYDRVVFQALASADPRAPMRAIQTLDLRLAI